MSTKNKLLIILSNILILTIFFVYFSNNKNDINDHDSKDNSGISDDLLINYIKMSSEIQESYMNNRTLIAEYLDKKESVLLYRFSMNMCNSCITEDLSELYNYQSMVGEDKILVTPAYEENRNNNIFFMNELVNFTYKNIPDSIFIIPRGLDSTHKRYFAYIDRKRNISMIFFPIKGKTKLTQMYFSEINKMMDGF